MMVTMFLIIGLAILVGGIVTLIRNKQYEFNNMTDGGVVQFDSYWHSCWHRGKGLFGAVLLIVGALMTIGGIAGLLK